MYRFAILSLLLLLAGGCASLPAKAKPSVEPLPKSEAQAILRRIDAERDQAQCDQAVTLWKQGRHAEAEQLLQQVVDRNPMHLTARQLLADLALDRGDEPTAEQLLIALLRDQPHDQATQAALAWLYESQGRSELARDLFSQLDPEFTATAHP